MFQVDAGNNKILMSSNPASDTQSTPHDTLTLALAYASSGADGAAGLGPRLVFRIPDDGTNPSTGGGIAVVKESADDSNSVAAMTFATSQNDETLDEAMRIDSSGRLLLNTTGVYSDSNDIFVAANGRSNFTAASHSVGAFNRNTSTGEIITFLYNGSGKGSISTDGSNIAFNTSSDARLKDVTGEARGLEVINALNPVAYNWKADGKADEGLIAQEVLDIVPNAVSGSEEEYYQMDYSKLVTPLVKAIQEQQTIIEELKTRIETLEG